MGFSNRKVSEKMFSKEPEKILEIKRSKIFPSVEKMVNRRKDMFFILAYMSKDEKLGRIMENFLEGTIKFKLELCEYSE